ncbi:Glutathione synthetase [Coemansia sp. RSA 989]|nr:Glutathione synthetase [Coemansia sp. RSA 989]KAJ1872506.1 Glutathione synthetase [Coemansia sp. RSA 990]KAJ2677245.1 Glutathione synthetase [Coemansia sp. RSA 1085]
MSLFATTNSEFRSRRPRYSQAVQELKPYVDTALDWQATHGLLFRAPRSDSGASWQQSALVPTPVALAPSPIPRKEFEKVITLQPELNKLFDRISRDHEFLVTTLESLGTADDFTSRVFDMYLKQQSTGAAKPGVIGIHRSDYLIHAPENEPNAQPQAKQVEFNTIAASFGSLSAIVGDFHRFMLKRTGYEGLLKSGEISQYQLPVNESLTSIGDGLAAGFELYGQPEHNIKVLRLSFAEIKVKCHVDNDHRLFVGDSEVAVAYYRSGYAPTDFPSEIEWDGRWLVERSRAIAVPSLAYHLAGCKKIQQVLAQPGVVERFIADSEVAARVRECFVGLYPLDSSSEGQAAFSMAIEDPSRFVLKPQREGGGYNSYGEDIPKLLNSMSSEERRGYILMDLIRAPEFSSVLLRNGELVAADVVSELGIYGIWVR